MPSTVTASSLLNEPSCILGLNANEIDGASTKLFAQELLDVPRIVGRSRLCQPLVVQEVTPVSWRAEFRTNLRGGRNASHPRRCRICGQ